MTTRRASTTLVELLDGSDRQPWSDAYGARLPRRARGRHVATRGRARDRRLARVDRVRGRTPAARRRRRSWCARRPTTDPSAWTATASCTARPRRRVRSCTSCGPTWPRSPTSTTWSTGWCTRSTESAGGVTRTLKDPMLPTLVLPFAAGPVAGDLVDVGRLHRGGDAGAAARRRTPDRRGRPRPRSAPVTPVAAPPWCCRCRPTTAASAATAPTARPRRRSTWSSRSGPRSTAAGAAASTWSPPPSAGCAAPGSWTRTTPSAALVETRPRRADLLRGRDGLVAARPVRPRRCATLRARAPIRADLSGGLGSVDHLRDALAPLAEELERRSTANASTDPSDVDADADADAAPTSIGALLDPPTARRELRDEHWRPEPTIDLEDMVVVVGAGEVGPWGGSATRFDLEVDGELDDGSVVELAWTCGLIRWDAETDGGAWVDVETDEVVAEGDLARALPRRGARAVRHPHLRRRRTARPRRHLAGRRGVLRPRRRRRRRGRGRRPCLRRGRPRAHRRSP